MYYEIDHSHVPWDSVEYISFDPGENNGIVCWDRQGYVIYRNEYRMGNEFDSFLRSVEENAEPSLFIVEEYRIFGETDHSGSKVNTIQMIGQIQSTGRRVDARIIEQPARILKTAHKKAGVRYPNKGVKGRDMLSAYIHGVHYLTEKGILRPRVLEDG